MNALLLVVDVILVDLEVTKRVGVLRSSNDTGLVSKLKNAVKDIPKEVLEGVLLEVLLGKVLQVS